MWPNTRSLPWGNELALITVTVAALAARLACTEPGTAWFWPPAVILAFAAGAIVLRWLDLRRHLFSCGAPDTQLTRAGLVIAVLLLVAPFVEGFGRIWAETYCRPLEQVTIIALTNLAFFAAALPRLPRAGVLALGVSLFLVIAAVALGEHPAIAPLAASFAGLGVAWLVHRHWQRIVVASSSRETARVPFFPVVCLVLLLGGVTAMSTRVAQGLPDVWGEWAPSSGGSGGGNPLALLGIGDGDWAIGGPNARSTGSVDTEYVLESNLPTLYDAMTESYGEARPRPQTARTIFVAMEYLIRTPDHAARDAGEPGRRFSLYRKGRPQKSRSGPEATALLYVEGRVPLHLPLTVYDRFDGVAWCKSPERNDACELQTRASDKSWLWLPTNRSDPLFRGDQRHQLRIGRFSTDHLPLPAHAACFRFGKHSGRYADRWARNTIKWVHEGILRTDKCMPSGTLLDVTSSTVDRTQLASRDDLFPAVESDDACLSVPLHLQDSAAALARRFEHLPRGWLQIESLADHLRTHCVHDRDATVPPDCQDPIHHFLHQARGGPAYQFATAAALALRSLGYPTRVVSGFYADPDAYVARSGHTAVRADHAHFWVEVRCAPGMWLTVDATPGYEVPWYRETLMTRFASTFRGLWSWCYAHPLQSLVGAAFSVVLWWRRRSIHERLLTGWLMWWPFWSAEQRVLCTLRLADLRSMLSGRSRPSTVTPRAWYRWRGDSANETFLSTLYEVLYGTVRCRTPDDERATERVCRQFIRELSVRRLRDRLGAS